MKKGLTEVVYILDRSGSMGGLEKDTIGGFNAMLKQQKKEEGEAVISTVLFDNEIEILHDRVDIKTVKPMTGKDYYVRGCTSLLDAIGTSIAHIKAVHKAMDKSERPEKTLFIITTDGYENSSTEYSYEKVKELVEKQKNKKGWEFLFIGANIDAIEVAGQFGINANRAMNYHADSKGTAVSFASTTNLVSAFRSAKRDDDIDVLFDECCAPINEDYKKRSKN